VPGDRRGSSRSAAHWPIVLVRADRSRIVSGPHAFYFMDARARRLATLRAALRFLQLSPRAPEAARIIIGLCVALQVACTARTDVRRVP